MAVWGGAGGHFVSWGPVLSVRDPSDRKTVLAATRFSGMFWLIGTVFALHGEKIYLGVGSRWK